MSSARRVALVGGAGYVGQNLAKLFCSKGFNVLVIDSSDCPPKLKSLAGITFKKLSITDDAQIRASFVEFFPSLVIHLASMGMSGSAMLSELCTVVNVDATKSLLDVCVDLCIPNFVYTSSYNVVYGGKEIINGDESMPYFPVDKHTDQYSATKALAEQLVLKANGTKMKNAKVFKTASIRPAAIYGVEEQRHLPRIVKHMDNGLFMFKIANATVDWVDVDNLVRAYELLVDKMYSCTDAAQAPAGQAYFISDGTPVENFEFLRPLCVARGRTFPSIVLSTQFMLVVAYFLEKLYFASKAFGAPIEPFLTRAEVYKVGYSHYFSIAKATRELGYEPLITSAQGAERIARRYREDLTSAEYFEAPTLVWWVSIVLGMVLTGIVAFCDPEGAVLNSVVMRPINALALAIFCSQPNLKILFWTAVLTHVGEACWAVHLATQVGCFNTWKLWGLQTLILGYPSMQLLYRRQRFMAKIKDAAR